MKEDIIGKRIGIFDVIAECNHRSKDGHKLYHVVCSQCGFETDMRRNDVKPNTQCTHMDMLNNMIDFKVRFKSQRIRRIWRAMKVRCYDIHNKDYKNYGERGIQICDEWLHNPLLFEEWSLNNGYTDELTIDRIDSDNNYCPENCRWVTLRDNAKYKSTTRLINVDGVIHTGRDWARVLGLGLNMINKYVQKYGLDDTIEFIRRFQSNPTLQPAHKQSYYELYMNEHNTNQNILTKMIKRKGETIYEFNT